MIFSYLKIAWKVLLRRKFFTLISLVGISFTLMILLVGVALYDRSVGAYVPELHPERLLFGSYMQMQLPGMGEMKMRPSYWLINQHLRKLGPGVQTGISGEGQAVAAYVGGRKLALALKPTDGGFWRVLQFRFLAGRPYSDEQARTGEAVAVISARTARQYFGPGRPAVGQLLEANEKRYRVVGVVADVPTMRFHAYADIWAPYEQSALERQPEMPFGESEMLLLAPSAAAVPAVQAALRRAVAAIPMDNNESHISLTPTTLGESVAERLLARYNWTTRPVQLFRALSAGAVALLLLLPALNLISMNVSRMRERASEIGIRKAFGATAGMLAGQFLVETVVLTLLGGLLGLLLAAALLRALSSGYLAAYGDFQLSLVVFGWALVATLVFGLLSGAYPAWRMARLSAVEALKHARA
ncbi:ABC transporter permease [Hymenobacter psychrophilus]|uniref:Putative ABC transport system permease protein n=1 Tax=Hymenobacter psychrophilus TaxID=651662 RepID=A0A1H3NK77_9BACT|nr:ABC transporter permease [Hymenobacter psychrophilus]SDY88845.1 putative ABC transport system permease protein [Hymenobacter psychrophilus]